MLVKKYLTEDLRNSLSGVCSKCGFTLDDVIRSGLENPDSNIGAYAGDKDCYKKFAPLFDPIIEDYHGFSTGDMHRSDFRSLDAAGSAELDRDEERILSTRIRVARNVEEFVFPPAISTGSRLELERRISTMLENFEGELKGTYHGLQTMTDEMQTRLVKEHFLFKKGDRFLEAAGINREWPSGRGIFYNMNRTFLVWVNEEDHLRIISMEQGGDLVSVYERLRQAVAWIGEQLPFAKDDRLGYLSSCPTNLGTAMRASVHVKLATLGQRKDFKVLCDGLKLSVRGIHGEHSESEGGVWDISNKQRLGISEAECIEVLAEGVAKLLELDERG